jgi:hypothetical protein
VKPEEHNEAGTVSKGMKGGFLMRRAGSIVLWLVPTLLCVAGLAFAGEPYRERFDQTYPLDATGRVALSNLNGNVEVEVWDQDAVRVQAVKKAESWYELRRLRIEVTSTPSFLKIETHFPSGTHRFMSVEYTLTVPWGATLDTIEVVNGGLTVADLGGDIIATVVNGQAKLTGLGGDIEVQTVNGRQHVELELLSFCQRVDLETVNGPIEVRLGSSVSAKVRAEAVIGPISNEFGLPVSKHGYLGAVMTGSIGSGGGKLRLKTVNGAINLGKL